MAKTYPLLPRGIWRDPVHILAFGFGSGLCRKGPGTMGTLAAVPFVWLALHLSLTSYLVVLLVAMVAGFYICGKAADDMGVHDHPGIVWDEFVGYGITLIAAPDMTWSLLIGFIWFRIFDIAKPWPIRLLDRHVHGGIGIMADDIAAGVLACAALHATYSFL
ncbi:phosphatidylglycerophosphatase A [Pokkaliibacter sp. CJK22405]|uniref:phosphatidylglycerophosphatase A family protein n=1 Tax=Pokkaliibacter sp. CJK22405 TaxID=3384615 RepID=UPI003984888E